MDLSRNEKEMQKKCKELKNYHIIINMKDGSKMDGIITDVNDFGVTILVGEDVIIKDEEGKSRQMPRRYRRYVGRVFPYNILTGLSLLLYPVIAPPYPYGYPY